MLDKPNSIMKPKVNEVHAYNSVKAQRQIAAAKASTSRGIEKSPDPPDEAQKPKMPDESSAKPKNSQLAEV